MRAVVQRVLHSKVTVDGEIIGAVDKGYMILLGVVEGDTRESAQLLARKIANLRVFEDGEGKMNLSLLDINGEALAVSQFTLCADCKKGNRPSFSTSAPPKEAEELYEYFMQQLKENGVKRVEHGSFGADMQVEILNDGPVTIMLDTDIWTKKQ